MCGDQGTLVHERRDLAWDQNTINSKFASLLGDLKIHVIMCGHKATGVVFYSLSDALLEDLSIQEIIWELGTPISVGKLNVEAKSRGYH
jgi:hypothetical protein